MFYLPQTSLSLQQDCGLSNCAMQVLLYGSSHPQSSLHSNEASPSKPFLHSQSNSHNGSVKLSGSISPILYVFPRK